MRRDLRATILAAAEHLFSERGYAAPSLRDLLAAAEVSTTAFYARFSGKDAVLEALVEQLLEALTTAAAEVVSQATDLDEGRRLGIEALVGVLMDHRGLVRVTLTEGMAVPAVCARLSSSYSALVAVLAPGFGSEDRAWTVVGALAFQVTRWAVLSDLADDDLPDALAAVAR